MDGEPPSEDTAAQVAAHVKAKKIRYPLYYDQARTVARALGVKRHPRAFLLDRQGKVIWEGYLSERPTQEVENVVRAELRD